MGSNPTLSARVGIEEEMMKPNSRLLVVLSVLLLASGAFAQTLNDYLIARKKAEISAPTKIKDIGSFIGEKTFEIRGLVNGVMETTDKTLLNVKDSKGDADLFIYAKECPSWLKSTNTSARMLVKITRESELSGPKTELIMAVSEMSMALWETENEARIKADAEAAKKRAEAEAKAKARTQGSSTSRSSTRMPGNLPSTASSMVGRTEPGANVDIMPVLPAYTNFILSRNKNLGQARAQDIAYVILDKSVRYGVDPRLTMSLVMCESNYNPNARSHAGAMGLGQLMPGTARMLGVSNPYDIEQNVDGAVRYLREQLDTFVKKTGSESEGLVLALAAYNAGPGAVRKHGGVPPYKETQNYVRKVLTAYKQLLG